ncbi:hypothetical protein BGZ76_006404 [Entomortierella beljakovae]|nr:hypothetical protein BGZ76_006404 [Entomortierella beljakovae]
MSYKTMAAPVPVGDGNMLGGLNLGGTPPSNPIINIRDASRLEKSSNDDMNVQYVPGGTGSGGQYSKDKPYGR